MLPTWHKESTNQSTEPDLPIARPARRDSAIMTGQPNEYKLCVVCVLRVYLRASVVTVTYTGVFLQVHAPGVQPAVPAAARHPPGDGTQVVEDVNRVLPRRYSR